MGKKTNLWFWTFLLISFSACQDDDQSEPSMDSIEAKLYATTKEANGSEKTVFEQNSDITMGLKLINTSNVAIEAGDLFSYCAVYEIEEFLMVYKWVKNDHDHQGSWIPLGKAFVPPIFCQTIYIPVKIPANGEFAIAESSWSRNAENLPLGPGKYYTALPYTLELHGKTKNFDLKLEFEVE